MELIQQLGKYVEMIPLNTTEIVALAILLYGAVMGLKNGFLKELASMTGFFIGLYLAWKYYEQIGGGAIAFIGIWVSPLLHWAYWLRWPPNYWIGLWWEGS